MRFLKTSNLLFRFNKERKLVAEYIESIRPIHDEGVHYGNYYLHKEVKLDADGVVYSLGILQDVAFDSAVVNKVGCNVYMYDPTPVSIQFMQRQAGQDKFVFHPLGIWIEEKTMRFYNPKYGGSSSLYANNADQDYFEARCITMQTAMRDNGHDHIHVLKADIEGAALPVLLNMVEQGIYPDQIVAEFEILGGGQQETDNRLAQLSELRLALADEGFAEFLLPRTKAKYFSIEMLFVKKSVIAA